MHSAVRQSSCRALNSAAVSVIVCPCLLVYKLVDLCRVVIRCTPQIHRLRQCPVFRPSLNRATGYVKVLSEVLPAHQLLDHIAVPPNSCVILSRFSSVSGGASASILSM